MKPSLSLSLRAGRRAALQCSRSSPIRSSCTRNLPQDMPPSGGYDPVQYKRNLPAIGFKPMWYILGTGAIMTFGFYKLGVGIREWNELAREKMWARIHLIPLLQAEEDRDQVRRWYNAKEQERDLLGGESKIYNTDKFIRPTYAVTPPPNRSE